MEWHQVDEFSAADEVFENYSKQFSKWPSKTATLVAKK